MNRFQEATSKLPTEMQYDSKPLYICVDESLPKVASEVDVDKGAEQFAQSIKNQAPASTKPDSMQQDQN